MTPKEAERRLAIKDKKNKDYVAAKTKEIENHFLEIELIENGYHDENGLRHLRRLLAYAEARPASSDKKEKS